MGETAEPGRKRAETPSIVILTGAGISAESGLGTFRDKDGLWSRYDLEEVATPQGFARNPKLVQEFYNARRKNLLDAKPNAAHEALAKLQRERPGHALIVTQNIDDLHERAGADPQDVIHMHGELLKAHCNACGARRDWREDLSIEARCDACGAVGAMRPSVVWFGEYPLEMARIEEAVENASLFVSIGTSGQVYPAAGYVEIAQIHGARTLELNLERSSSSFDEARTGKATDIVPAWVEEILAASA
ncbi:MAG: NAD-dependent deacylase [Pseudomonadota bacterium]